MSLVHTPANFPVLHHFAPSPYYTTALVASRMPENAWRRDWAMTGQHVASEETEENMHLRPWTLQCSAEAGLESNSHPQTVTLAAG